MKAKGKIIDRESFEFDEDISATLNSEEEDVGGKSSSSNHELDDKKYSPSNFDGGVNVEVQKKNRTDSRHHSNRTQTFFIEILLLLGVASNTALRSSNFWLLSDQHVHWLDSCEMEVITVCRFAKSFIRVSRGTTLLSLWLVFVKLFL